MDPYSSPYIIPTNHPYNPFPPSLLSNRELSPWLFLGVVALGEVSSNRKFYILYRGYFGIMENKMDTTIF